MKKFSKILESNTNVPLVMNPKDSLERIVDYMGDEENNFQEYMSEYLDMGTDNIGGNNGFNNWLEDYKSSETFDEFIKVMEDYDVLDDAKDHIYFHIKYMESFINNVAGNALKKINKE